MKPVYLYHQFYRLTMSNRMLRSKTILNYTFLNGNLGITDREQNDTNKRDRQ